MTTANSPVNQTICKVREISYCLPIAICDRCQSSAESFATANRTAIDLNLEYPVLLHITVSVHHCSTCEHYFRAQPPFLRPRAIYTNRVVDRAVKSVYEDGMAMRRVTTRMARDFWVQPSEGIIRRWCEAYSAEFDFETDYQPWVVSEFSGILCVDEVYQGHLALLLAVDPAAPDGDRLVGYQLIHGDVTADDVEHFLARLRQAGIEPDEVVTDGSALYPRVLTKLWPEAAHQLCLFHETRRITKAVSKAINAIRKRLPHPPPLPGIKGGGGPLRDQPPSDDPTDAATQRWYWRQGQRQARIAHVHELAHQGLSQRAIARQTGHHRDTISRWLQQPVPSLPEDAPAELAELASLPAKRQRRERKRRLRQRIHTLAQQGLSYSAIAREVGIHRVTVSNWLQEEVPQAEVDHLAERKDDMIQALPPDPWSDWNEVRQVREALQKHRFLLLRRPEHLNPEEQELMTSLLNSPLGSELQVVRAFLEDWYSLWVDEDSQCRSLTDAQARYEAWRDNPAYRAVSQLRHVQGKMTETKFERLSQFLRHPEWEATNNSAERAGRAFRHLQAPHFNLRKKESIENAINVTVCSRMNAALQSLSQPFHTCQRGRKQRQEHDIAAMLFSPAISQRTASPACTMTSV
jgi:transposase/transposase-like protein